MERDKERVLVYHLINSFLKCFSFHMNCKEISLIEGGIEPGEFLVIMIVWMVEVIPVQIVELDCHIGSSESVGRLKRQC